MEWEVIRKVVVEPYYFPVNKSIGFGAGYMRDEERDFSIW